MVKTVAQLTVILDDLRVALNDPDGKRDPVGMFGAWQKVVNGKVAPRTKYRPVGGATETGDPTLTRRKRGILAMAENWVSTGEMARSLGVSDETVRQDVQVLVAKGLLEHTGKKRGSRYRLCKTGRNDLG